MIAMDDEEWGEEDIREFTKLVENFEKAWEPASEKLEVINLGNKQEKIVGCRVSSCSPISSMGS